MSNSDPWGFGIRQQHLNQLGQSRNGLNQLGQSQLYSGANISQSSLMQAQLNAQYANTMLASSTPEQVPFEIKTDRLRLRQLETIYFGAACNWCLEPMVKWLNDPEVVKYSGQRFKSHTKTSQMQYLQSILSSASKDYWIIQLEDRDRGVSKPIGSITTAANDVSANINIGIMIGEKDCHGHGYALEAMSAVINHCVGKGAKSFEIGTMVKNVPMIRLAQSCGMKTDRVEGDYVYMSVHI